LTSSASEQTAPIARLGAQLLGKLPDMRSSELSALIRSELSGLEPDTRRQLLDSIVSGCAPQLEAGGSTTLCRNLRLMRNALREPFPNGSVDDGETHSLQVSEMLGIDGRSFWIRGWIRNVDGGLTNVTMVSPEGSRAEVLPRMFRHPRPDIDSTYPGRNGFISFFELDVPSHLSDGWIAELRDRNGTDLELEAPPVNRAALEVRELITRALRDVPGDKHALVSELAHPALSRVQAHIARSVAIETVAECGDAPHAPGVSIVVALRDRLDALEHQLCQVSRDPDVIGSDLIYVLDSLQDAHELAPKALELYGIYGVPFRLMALSGKAGPTVMVDKAVSQARARRLLLLSPDVVPDAPGWLGKMSAFYDSQRGIGALGPLLLYEDGSVQHAGLRLERASPQESGLLPFPGQDIWEPRSRFKGLPGALAGPTEAAPVPAIAGACLMIDRALFEEGGGLRNAYAEDQYEDVDLCLRLLEAGRGNWYFPGSRLYYLEGRSDLEPSLHARQYNALLLSHLWGASAASFTEAA
jgi:hypothetical protein